LLDQQPTNPLPPAVADRINLPFAQQPSLCHISLRLQNLHFRGAD